MTHRKLEGTESKLGARIGYDKILQYRHIYAYKASVCSQNIIILLYILL